jgi:hypothetical protein
MKAKKVIGFACALVGAYFVGKIVGVNDGAKAVLDKYAENIPDESTTVNLVNNALVTMSVTAKKSVKK